MAGPFPTTTTTTCREKFTSVTLAEGEQFVLPPGATLVSTTDVGALTHDGCLDTSQLEELVCYEIAIMSADIEINGSPFANNDGSDYIIQSFVINGTEYPVNALNSRNDDYGYFELNYLINDIQNPTFGLNGMLIEPCWGWVCDDNANQGCQSILVFKAIPSIAKEMYIKTYTNIDDGGGSGVLYWKAQPFGTVAATPGFGCCGAEFNFSCTCETGSSS